MSDKHILIIGCGFAGLSAAKKLCSYQDIQITLVDKRNHHLFQPLLYQVAMAGLGASDISFPIRSIFSKYDNVKVFQGSALDIKLNQKLVQFDFCELNYDYLIVACGAQKNYFGNSHWEKHAPSLKSIEEAIDMRQRILSAFEEAEKIQDPKIQSEYLTFVVVGGGPTGVELAGAIGEISRFTLAKDFKNINVAETKIFLIEAGPRILPTFSKVSSDRASKDLHSLGVEVKTSSQVTDISNGEVCIGHEKIKAKTVLWAAGVQASHLGKLSGLKTDNNGRVIVEKDLSVTGFSNVFVVGDMARLELENGQLVPGMAPAAIQQGQHAAENILTDLKKLKRKNFVFKNKGQMATIGRSCAVVEVNRIRFFGFFAWLFWMGIHIYFLNSFKNRMIVFLQWAWSYITFKKGARLILENWKRKF